MHCALVGESENRSRSASSVSYGFVLDKVGPYKLLVRGSYELGDVVHSEHLYLSI